MNHKTINIIPPSVRGFVRRISFVFLLSLFIYHLLPVAVGSMQSKSGKSSNFVGGSDNSITNSGVFTQDSNHKIAFSAIRTQSNDIFTMNPDGSNQTNITNTLMESEDQPAWSPDGSKIAYVKFVSGGGLDIFTMNVDGSNQTRLTTDPSDDQVPDWSPDGTKIIFTSKRAGAGDIYVMNSDGTNQTRLTTNASNFAGKFSPDGTKIVFESNRDGDYEIYLMNTDGTNQIRLTDNTVFDGIPDFSPDGTKIAFHSGRDVGFNIFVMDADGGNQINISNTGNDWLASWSADGTKIVFASTRDSGNGEIYLMNADGSSQTRLTNNSTSDYFPAWQHLSGDITVAPAANVAVSFAAVTQSGYTVAAPLAANQLPAFPNGYAQAAGTTAYDIHTSAQFTGIVKVRFIVPNVVSASGCQNLRILHYVSGAWQASGNFAPVYNAGTQTCTLAQSTGTLSPFAVAQELAPTAAGVSIGGRVLTSDGRGIRNVNVSLVDLQGNIHRAISSSFGYYRFDNIPSGETVIVSAAAKRFTFSQPSQVLNVTEDTGGIDFVADDFGLLRK